MVATISFQILVKNLHSCTVHVDNIKSFICPTNAHINYSKIVELLKTFKTTIIGPTCFGLHKPSPGSEAQTVNSLMMVYVNRNILEQLLQF